MKNIFAFADEYGNNSFDFDKQGTHFIVASVIVAEKNREHVESEVELVRKKYFQTGEIKSKSVGANDQRRRVILAELVKSDFTIYAVVVNKQKLTSEGFKYKKSFYKFLNGLLYGELFKTFPDLKLAVDEHGHNEFMRGFKKYVLKNHKPNLFTESEFSFSNSPDSILIQAADFIAGTLGRCFDESKKSPASGDFFDILKPKISAIKEFPPERYNYDSFIKKDADETYNFTIAELGVSSALQYIEKAKTTSQDEIDRVNCTRLLLLYFQYYSAKEYIPTKEIIRHLQVGRTENISEHYFRTKVIGKMRDSGILVVSSTSGEKGGGYKLPSSEVDLYTFVKHGKSVILPMLKRISILRDKVKLATQNEIDILENREFTELRSVIDLKK